MYWLFTDETNTTDKDGDFFIYGGVIVTPEMAGNLHDAVEQIRHKYGFRDGDQFKFQTKSRPRHVTLDDFSAAKAEANRALLDHGAIVMIYVVLHDLARSKTIETMTEWALNSLLYHFDVNFLRQKNDFGAVCIDRLDPKQAYSYMRETFAHGVAFPNGSRVKLGRVIHYSMSSDGASHLSSLTDIALGSVRYAVNFATGQGNETVARKVLQPVAAAMWHQVAPDGTHKVGGYGFLQYPKTINAPSYRARYDALVKSLGDLGSTPD
ncbi:MAG: hypothetical protein QM747_15395 [Nocardioides sp.]